MSDTGIILAGIDEDVAPAFQAVGHCTWYLPPQVWKNLRPT